MSRKTRTPVNVSYFDNPNLTVFDFLDTDVVSIPLKNNLIPKITKARFSRCGLVRIPEGLNSYTSIKILDLTENLISELSSDDLQNFPVLQILDLSTNFIKTINCNFPSSLTTLDLSFNSQLQIDSVWNIPVHLENIKLCSCNIKSLPNRAPFWNDSIQILHLDGNDLKDIPKFIWRMPNLEEFSVFGNELKCFTLSDISHTYKKINLSYNHIDSIALPSTNNLRIQNLLLNANPIPGIPISIFSLCSLRFLSLSRVGITGILNINFPPMLAVIDFSHNCIEGFTQSTISCTKSLSIITLSHNHIKEIPDCFPEQRCLTQFICDYNFLESVPSTLLQTKTLEKLNLSHNRISSLPPFKLPQLRDLNISFNQLSCLPDTFSNSTFLCNLNFSFNKLSELPKSLSGCRRVLDVSLNGNLFTQLPRCLFSFAQLHSLYLSGNLLTTLPRSFSSFFFLKTLDISNNHIVTLPAVFEHLSNLKILNISRNLISELSPSVVFPSQLLSLDLSSNLLTAIPPLTLNSLTDFSIAFNPLPSFPESIIGPSLTYLSIGPETNFDPTELHSRFPSLSIVEDNRIAHGEFRCGIGCAGTRGFRPSMEDASLAIGDSNFELIAVFDGHAGSVAARTAAKSLASFAHRARINTDGGFEAVFGRLQGELEIAEVPDGCTAAIAVRSEGKIRALGMGDSRVLLVTKSGVIRMTEDAKPLDPREFMRLKRDGLGVSPDGRIFRKLAVARALGDFWCREGLFVAPEIVEGSNNDVKEDENEAIAVVVACDGVWDVLDDDTVGEIVRGAKSAQDAASMIVNFSVAMQTRDNVSAVVAMLNPTDGFSGYVTKNVVERIPVVEDNEDSDDEPIFPMPVPSGRRRR